jgi:hypothetical protein
MWTWKRFKDFTLLPMEIYGKQGVDNWPMAIWLNLSYLVRLDTIVSVQPWTWIIVITQNRLFFSSPVCLHDWSEISIIFIKCNLILLLYLNTPLCFNLNLCSPYSVETSVIDIYHISVYGIDRQINYLLILQNIVHHSINTL